MKRKAWLIVAAVITAGVVHALAGHHLAALDPIAALLGRHPATAVVAAIGLTLARLFLYVVAPGWAACFAVAAIARAIAIARSR
jgi:hypothetical protein